MFEIGSYKSIFFQIALASPHGFLVHCIRAYTWAKRPGQTETFGIGHAFPEERPCPVSIGLNDMDGTALSGLKKNTIAIFTRPYLSFPVPENATSIRESLFFRIQVFVKTFQILGTQDSAAFPFATLTARLAVKGSFLHDISFLGSVYVRPWCISLQRRRSRPSQR